MRETPGSEAIGSRSPLPFRTKRGAINCSGESRVSRTSAREAGLRRSRRRRVVGKRLMEAADYCAGAPPASASSILAAASKRASSVTAMWATPCDSR